MNKALHKRVIPAFAGMTLKEAWGDEKSLESMLQHAVNNNSKIDL